MKTINCKYYLAGKTNQHEENTIAHYQLKLKITY